MFLRLYCQYINILKGLEKSREFGVIEVIHRHVPGGNRDRFVAEGHALTVGYGLSRACRS